MFRFVISRVGRGIPVLLIASVALFALIRAIPGDPALALGGPDASPETIAALRETLALDAPLWQQYLTWMGQLVQFDLGTSLISKQPVIELVGYRFSATLALVLAALFIAIVVGVGLGVLAGLRRGTVLDNILSALTATMMGIAPFWLGYLLILLFAVTEAPRSDAEVALTVGSLATGAAVISVWAWRVVRRSESAGVSHLRVRALWTSHVTSLFLGAALFATFVALPVFIEVGDATAGPLTPATLAGLLLLPATAAMAAVGPLSGILRRRLGRRGPAVLGAAATVIGGIILAAGAHTLPTLLAGSVLVGAGVATGSAGLVNVLVDVTDDDTISSVSGVNIAARQIGGAFGAAGCAALLATSGDEPDPASYALAFGLIAVLAVAALLASFLIPARQAPGEERP